MADTTEYKEGALGIITTLLIDPTPALKKFGEYWVNKMRSSFRTQGRGKPWAPRRVPNIPAIMRDLENGPNVKGRRFDDRPAVIDTGRLRDSLAWRIISKFAIEAGTTVPYAALQNFGGTSSVTWTANMRENLAKHVKREAKKARKQGARSVLSSWIGFLFSVKIGAAVLFRVRAREFVAFLPEDRAKLYDFWARQVRAACTGKEL